MWFFTSFGIWIYESARRGLRPGLLTQDQNVFSLALIAGEVLSLSVFGGCFAARMRKWFVIQSVGRIRNVTQSRAVLFRLSLAFDDLERSLSRRVTDFQEFFLRDLGEDPTVLPDELPADFGELTRAILLDFGDRAQQGGKAWTSTNDFVDRLALAVQSEDTAISLRSLLTRTYAKASPWYRKRAVAPTPGPFIRFFKTHRTDVETIVAITIFLTALIQLLT